MSSDLQPSRRRFMAALAAGLAGLAGVPPGARQPCHGGPVAGPHPDPRPGIDGSGVMTAAQLSHRPDLAALFDGIREIPQIADGIRCLCGCSTLPGFRSLLICFEGDYAMAQHCEGCQTEGRMVVRLHQAGRTLDQIRAAVDARFQ